MNESLALFLRLFMPYPETRLTLTESYLMLAIGIIAICGVLIGLLLYAEGRRAWTNGITNSSSTARYARPTKGGSRTDTGDRD